MSNKEIKVYLEAGLGNQIFMIFNALSYSLDHNIDFKIISYNNRTMNGTKTYWNTILDSFKDKITSDFTEKFVYNEPTFEYIPLPDNLATGNYVIKGFYQSYKYFEHNYNTIKEIMKLKEKMSLIKEEYKSLFTKKTIAVHFRLGDYIGLQNYHCIKGPDYYLHALKALENDLKKRGENIDDYNILYFCQQFDKHYIDQYLKVIQNMSNINYNFIKVPDEIDDWKQMLIMALCDHFIIANSSYSWIGAFFSENSDKIVYYPRIWFGPALNKHNTKDLCPPSWKSINC